MLVRLSLALISVGSFIISLQNRPTLIVVDKQTRRPLAAVSIRVDNTTLYTDAEGKVLLPATYVAATATHIGYAPFSWSGAHTLFPDTLALQPQAIALPEVQVRALQTVNVTSINRKTAAANPFYPGTEVAIRFTVPDPSQTYRLRTVTVPLKEPFKEGRIRLNICLRGDSTTLLGSKLLPDTVFSSPVETSGSTQTQVHFDVASFGLMLPKTGFYLVLDCLSKDAASQIIRQRLASKKGPNKKGAAKGVMYLEVENQATGGRSVSVYDYPQLLTTPAEGPSVTWRRFSPTLPFQQLSPSVSRGNKVRTYNIAAALEVEAW